ncbi:MAG: glucoamylase family protein [Phycisphaerales bacterium]
MTTVTDGAAAPRPPFKFNQADDKLLGEVQHAAFLFLWHDASQTTGMVRDRSSKPEVSIAGVGFQLAAIPAAVERGWVTRAQGLERVRLILTSLEGNPSNRKHGLFYHYLDPTDAGPAHTGYEHVVSTIDNALLFAGMIVAGEFFRDDASLSALSDRLVASANWSAFVARGESYKPSERNFITLGWKPTKKDDPTGDGHLLPYVWMDAGDEQKLTTFLAVAAPKPEHRVPAETYYKMRRNLGVDPAGSTEPFFWFQWSGALFTSFFAHCFIDFGLVGPDNPAALGVEHRPAIDWWVSSRRTVLMHRRKAIENPRGLPGLGENLWGMNASDAPDGYRVPGLFPTPLSFEGLRPGFDFPEGVDPPKDDWGDGTAAAYSAGCSVMFTPSESVAALRHLKGLKDEAGQPLMWREPEKNAASDQPRQHFGFLDSINLGKRWVAEDYVAIDQGPLVLAIENARTGLIWKLFHRSAVVREGAARLKWKPVE